MDKATVSRAIQRLTADGYLSRLDDPARRRSFFAELTPTGLSARDHMFALAKARNERWLSALGKKDADRFVAMLDTLERSLREMLTSGQPTPAGPIARNGSRKRSAPVEMDLVKKLHAALGKVLEDMDES